MEENNKGGNFQDDFVILERDMETSEEELFNISLSGIFNTLHRPGSQSFWSATPSQPSHGIILPVEDTYTAFIAFVDFDGNRIVVDKRTEKS